MSNIHPTAIIEENVRIGKEVTIEPYAIIKGHVVLEDRTTIKSHVYLDGHTVIGEGTVVWPYCSIGTPSQDLKFKGEETFVTIGKHCQIRESVTINASCGKGSSVNIGDHCLLMAHCHVAHNCTLGNYVVMANNVLLAGHVVIEDRATVGGMTGIHQHVRIGTHSMIGGVSRIAHDVPPFMICGGIPAKLGGLNVIGLKRNNISLDKRKELNEVFREIYRSGNQFKESVKKLSETTFVSDEAKHLVAFCRSSKRGLTGLHGVASVKSAL